jgi:hypothetical protein
MTLYTPVISNRVHRALTLPGAAKGTYCVTVSTRGFHYELQPVSVGSFSEPYETHEWTLRGKCTLFYVQAYDVCTCNEHSREGLN